MNTIGFGFSLINWPMVLLFFAIIWPRRSNFLTIVRVREESNRSTQANNVKVKSLFTRSLEVIVTHYSIVGSLANNRDEMKKKERLKKIVFRRRKRNWSLASGWFCSTITVVKIRDRELFSRLSTSESWENEKRVDLCMFKMSSDFSRSSLTTYLLAAFPSLGTFSIYNIDTDSGDADQSDSCDSPDMSTLGFVERSAWRTTCSL